MNRFWWLLALAMWFSKAWAQTTTPVTNAEEPPVFHGAPMSMHFQSIDLRTALQLVAEFSGVNIIMADNVSGQLTMRLQDVPWDQVLHTILQTRGLGQQQTGNVIWVAPQAELSAREKTRLETRHAIQVVEPLQTRAFALNYAKAAEILPTLLQQGSAAAGAPPRLLSPRGSAMADMRTNQLFVTDIHDRLEQVARLIERIDVPQRQVLIEARIVEALDNFAASLGVRLTQSEGFNVNLPAVKALGSDPASAGFTFFDPAYSRRLGVELSALEAEGLGRVVASPRLVTANQFKAVIVRLEVTPHITPDGSINMFLEVYKDSVGQNTPAGFAIDTKHVSTQVRVQDGGTVMIGGIYETSDSINRAGVPGLRDNPLFGWLFGNRASKRSKQELLIFLSPKMLEQRAFAP
ncbi:MAG: type IV pilus secretin PilQ [Burkholderiales bacterium]|nr:type IV pilus secretin PilQ [Burkholderiales bacterium]